MEKKQIIEILEKYNELIDANTGDFAISDFDFDKIADELLALSKGEQEEKSIEQPEAEIPMGEISKAGSILQCYIGFGNDLDGHYESVLKAMEAYHAQFTTQRQELELLGDNIPDKSKFYINPSHEQISIFIDGEWKFFYVNQWAQEQGKGIDLREEKK